MCARRVQLPPRAASAPPFSATSSTAQSVRQGIPQVQIGLFILLIAVNLL